MSTPQFNSIVAKVRDWSNKPEAATIPDSVIESCLAYSADECYRKLRLPPFETTVSYTVESADNVGDGNTINGMFNSAYTSFNIPENLTEFMYLRSKMADTNNNTVNRVFNEITDKRGFFDIYYENYSAYNWMWSQNKIFIRPQLPVGTVLEIGYYRRFPPLDGVYAVIPVNYVVGIVDAAQPYLEVGTSTDTPLYTSPNGSGVVACFSTSAEAASYGTPVTTRYFVGREVSNWLRDQNERLLIWGALYNLGGYLFDDVMEKRYEKRFFEGIDSLNSEEKFRRARGGNVQMHFNAGGMI